MANNLKQQIMEYLNTQGFANDGFGTPISKNAKMAIEALIAAVECSPAASPEDYYCGDPNPETEGYCLECADKAGEEEYRKQVESEEAFHRKHGIDA